MPKGLWCADLKGEFLLGNRQYCYPLTITDYRSRYLLAREGLDSTRSSLAFKVFEHAFREFGLPQAIYTEWVIFLSSMCRSSFRRGTRVGLHR